VVDLYNPMPNTPSLSSPAKAAPASHWDAIQVFQDPAEHVTKHVFTKPDCAVESVLYRYPELRGAHGHRAAPP